MMVNIHDETQVSLLLRHWDDLQSRRSILAEEAFDDAAG